MNLRLLIAYDGTPFLGWQKTALGPTVEGALEWALRQLLGESVVLQAASRTDTGVHAAGQVANFRTQRQDLDCKKLHGGLRALLPPEISVLHVTRAADAFHPTLDNCGKEYLYHLCLGSAQLPFHRRFSWHIHTSLNVPAMREAADLLLKERDFTAFTSEPSSNPFCRLHALACALLPGERLQIAVRGDRFLYKMVRTLVGTLVQVGKGKLLPDAIPAIAASKQRPRAGMTAPAHGLTLNQVFYK
jgi:tRNA pseudouridine38-40 synthase